MTLHRLKEMTAYWQNNPPVHLMIASYFGISKEKKPEITDEASFGDLLAGVQPTF